MKASPLTPQTTKRLVAIDGDIRQFWTAEVAPSADPAPGEPETEADLPLEPGNEMTVTTPING